MLKSWDSLECYDNNGQEGAVRKGRTVTVSYDTRYNLLWAVYI